MPAASQMHSPDPPNRGSNPRGRSIRLARSVAERPVEARITVVRFHGQTPTFRHLIRSPWQVPRMVRDPAVNRAVREHHVGSIPTLPATYDDRSETVDLTVDTDHMKTTIPPSRRCAESHPKQPPPLTAERVMSPRPLTTNASRATTARSIPSATWSFGVGGGYGVGVSEATGAMPNSVKRATATTHSDCHHFSFLPEPSG